MDDALVMYRLDGVSQLDRNLQTLVEVEHPCLAQRPQGLTANIFVPDRMFGVIKVERPTDVRTC